MTHDLKLSHRTLITTLLRREALALQATDRPEAKADAQEMVQLATMLETWPAEKAPLKLNNQDLEQ